MKKTILLVMVITLAIMMVFGLAYAGGEKKGAEKEAAEKAPEKAPTEIREIKLYHDNPEWQSFWEEMGEASAQDIGVRAVPTAFETQVYKSRIKVDLPTSRAPSVFKWWFGYRAFELMKAGLLADLSDVWAKVEKNYPPGIKEALTIDGVPYALPFNVGYWVWFYSKAVYKKYNLVLPKTWDEFMKQLEFLKSKGVYGIGNTIGKSRWTSFIVPMELIYRVDADFYVRLMNGKAHYTDPEAVKAMEIWKEMLEKGYFAPMDATYVEDLPRMLKEGTLAYAPFGDWYGGILQQQGLVPEQDYGVFIPPPITPRGKDSIILEISPLCAGKNSPDLEAAKEWYVWYAGKHSAQILWEKLRFVNTVHITADEIKKGDPTLAHEMDLIKNYPNKMIRFWEATPVEIVEYAVDAFNTMLVHPDQYMVLLKGIEEKAKEVWPKYGVNY
ncbi:hypothetical protein DRJ04_08520 [Candidatus Aerophobetes bacterium]|uniref:Extracellular solute-binding protein n=1 Tax=Aerophobetes bacterium TaxID=2030807 RepID=A0A662DAM5_UNCAE|nr:MAG: hypothetical protein DRJ04_08520 [Candidatus Aerophobetes bacterium]